MGSKHYTKHLPEQLQPFPVYTGLQLHLKEPSVLMQVALSRQLWVLVWHSSTSERKCWESFQDANEPWKQVLPDFFFKREETLQAPAPTWTVVAISCVPWFATTVKGTFGVNAGGIVATVVSADLAFVYVWKKMLEEFSRRKQTLKTRFARFFFKVIRYSFPEPNQYFSIASKVIFSLSDRYKIFTSNWLYGLKFVKMWF